MGLYPAKIRPEDLGLPTARNARVWFVDTEGGSDTAPGTNPQRALKSVAAAYDRCVAGRNDVVAMCGRATGDTQAATLVWDKDFTHLVGLSGDLPGTGQRCRILGGADVDLATVAEIKATGCIFRNLQFYNGADKAEDSGAVVVSGARCEFTNVMFAGMGHATPAARAGSYSLKLDKAHENYFRDCHIGLDTIVRGAANAELVMAGPVLRNTFRGCRFVSASEETTKTLVSLTPAAAGSAFTIFEDCLFYNQSENWAASLTDAFEVVGNTGTYHIRLRGCQLIGVTGWANDTTRIYTADAQPNAGAGVSVAPTT